MTTYAVAEKVNANAGIEIGACCAESAIWPTKKMMDGT